MYGFFKVSSVVPKIITTDIKSNVSEILKYMKLSNDINSNIVVFPELCITGCDCQDLFLQDSFIDDAKNALREVVNHSNNLNSIFIIGVPLLVDNELYNCAVTICNGKIYGINIKTDFINEKFSNSIINKSVILDNCFNYDVIVSDKSIFKISDDCIFSIQIGSDNRSAISNSGIYAALGSLIIINISSEPSNLDNYKLIRNSIINDSEKYICGYIYSSTSSCESTHRTVYNGKSMILENGTIYNENESFSNEGSIISFDIDCNKLINLRKLYNFYDINKNSLIISDDYLDIDIVDIPFIDRPIKINRKISKNPFIDYNNNEKQFNEILKIQSLGLSNRIKYANLQKSILGISGGIDSTLALLVAVEAHKLLKKSNSDIITCIMPCFGTTRESHENATELCELFGCTIVHKNIEEICISQFKMLNIDHQKADNVYENVQARQRMIILMNIANKEKGIVIGTSDLSEIALGWTTYAGDNISMYSVNSGVPKTLIQLILRWYINTKISNNRISDVIDKIIKFPISPELLPLSEEKELVQKTEDIIGPYDLHDFFLYHIIVNNFSIEKIIFLAIIAFEDIYNKEFIKKCMKIFIHRLFSQQFKRNCISDGPQIGIFGLFYPKYWKIPSDFSYDYILELTNKIDKI